MSEDPERTNALETYRKTLLSTREWEAKLRGLRLEIKGQQKEFDLSEDNIKALQSVGQIIGEVLKQLDEERCKSLIHHKTTSNNVADLLGSHCESIIGTSICRRLPIEAGKVEAQARSKSSTGHDNTHNHAHATTRSRPFGVQYVLGRSRRCQLW